MTGSAPAGETGEAREHHVAIVGAGFSGIGLAIRLIERGTRDVVVFERADDVGGTWRDNHYPGAACDVPSNLYCFSFAPNPRWSRSFSGQPEIQAYLRDCVDRFGVRSHIRTGHEVTAARWDEDDARWVITTTGGTYRTKVLVSARGPLSEPRLPDVPGLTHFEGTMFHSARWDHAHDLSGERVAVIGTGASAIQFVPEIQPIAGRLFVFQRTPPWVLPRRDRRITTAEHALFARLPTAQLAMRAAIYWGREAYVAGFVGDERRRRARAKVAVSASRRLLAAQVRDRALRARLTPHYEMGCKRILLSNDYYPALCAPNVEVVSDRIVEVRPRSVLTVDGTERAIDTIVLGTGFDVTASAAAQCTVGREGVLLSEAWKSRLAAYKGMTVPGFPNFFLMVGPNSGLGHSSIVFIIESQISYILGALRVLGARDASCLEVTQRALECWTDDVDARSRSSVWTTGGCRSYYLDDLGRNVALWPGTSWSYRRQTRRFDPGAYQITSTPPSGRPAVRVAGDPDVAPAGSGVGW